MTNQKKSFCREWPWAGFYFFSLFSVSFKSSKSRRKMVWTVTTLVQRLQSGSSRDPGNSSLKIISDQNEISETPENFQLARNSTLQLQLNVRSQLIRLKSFVQKEHWNCKKTGAMMSLTVIKWVIVAVNNDVVSFMINFMNKDRKTIHFSRLLFKRKLEYG